MGKNARNIKQNDLKHSMAHQVALYRDKLRVNPHLVWLFFEITNRCNLRCRHCGSKCEGMGEMLQPALVRSVLKTVPDRRTMICLTGGEPMLHPQFFDIANAVIDEGFKWGMTTNATLIDWEKAIMLRRAGMQTVAVSLDGLESSHDALRQVKGSWKKAIAGIRALQDAGYDPMVTTVFHKGNLDEFEVIYELLEKIGVKSWRPINVEPIGRACEAGNMLLHPEEFRLLLSRICEKRNDPGCGMKVTYGCSHFLGVENEGEMRDLYFLCGAGIFVASVHSNGDICACLDIENRPELVQGNVYRDNFMDVWLNRFEAFRRDRTEGCDQCRNCADRYICGGDSMHTWDFDNNKPLLCGRDYMEK